MTHASHPGRRLRAGAVMRTAATALTLVFGLFLSVGPALAHGFSSVVFADLTTPAPGHVRAELLLEYDLLVVSAADAEKDDPLFRTGDAAFKDGNSKRQAAALAEHASSVISYVTQRFDVTADHAACTVAQDGPFAMTEREGVPYASLVLNYSCPESVAHEAHSALFPDGEGYVRDTKTIVTYDLDDKSGSAALDGKHSVFSTHQSTGARFWEFFRLGAEHLLTGPDHLLFLLALIVGSRRLREIVLAATAFTLAHSVTFILASLGLVHVSASIVEPAIALSISIAAGWHLWMAWQRRGSGDALSAALDAAGGHFSLDRAGWARLGVVFCFGLVHGLGFAGALGIDEPHSWTLLWSLVVFNLGIEAVQLSAIVLIYPLVAGLRRGQPVAGRWTTAAISVLVTVIGLIWFFRRVPGF